MGCVKEGDTVVFDENGERKAILKIKAGRWVCCCRLGWCNDTSY
jgi:hypothetical protein